VLFPDQLCNCLPTTGTQAAMEEEYRREFEEQLRDVRGHLRDDIVEYRKE
jgi:hypothetical protein